MLYDIKCLQTIGFIAVNVLKLRTLLNATSGLSISDRLTVINTSTALIPRYY